MAVTAFLSMWISNTATAMMMYPIGMAGVGELAQTAPERLSEQARESIKRELGLVVMLAIAYSASIGGSGTLIGTPPNVILAGQYQTLFPDATPLTFAKWMQVAVPIVVVAIPVCWLYLINFAGPRRLRELTRHLHTDLITTQQTQSPGPMSFAERAVLVVFVTTALLWIFRADIELGAFTIPGWSRVLGHPDYVTDSSVAITMGLLLFAIPADRKAGQYVLDWSCARDIPWGILLLFGGGFAIAQGMAESGLSTWIGGQLGVLESVPLWLVVVGCCTVMTLLTEITSNTAVAAVLLPVVAGLAVRLGADPLVVMVPATIAASFAFVLPVATPPNDSPNPGTDAAPG